MGKRREKPRSSHPMPIQRVHRMGKGWASSEKAYPMPRQGVYRMRKGWTSSGQRPSQPPPVPHTQEIITYSIAKKETFAYHEQRFLSIQTYSNFNGSPSKDSSATLIESVGQPSKASIMSSSRTSGISTIPWLSSKVTNAMPSSS